MLIAESSIILHMMSLWGTERHQHACCIPCLINVLLMVAFVRQQKALATELYLVQQRLSICRQMLMPAGWAKPC